MFGGTSSSGSQSIFGQTSSSSSTTTSTNPFGSNTSQSIFGVQKTSLFGGFGGTSTGTAPLFGVASTPKTHSGFKEFATTTSTQPSTQPAAGSSNIFGVQTTTPPSVKNSTASSMGSRAVPYGGTRNTIDEKDKNTILHTITGMKAYEKKSIEELRFEDYQLGDKGGKKNPPFASNTTTSSFTFTNPFDTSTKTNIFGPKSTPSPSPLWPSSPLITTQTTFPSPSPSPSTETFRFWPNPTATSPSTTTKPSTQPSPFSPNPFTTSPFTTPPSTQRSPFTPNPTTPSPIFTTSTTTTPTPLFPFSPNPTTPSPFTTTTPSTPLFPFSPSPITPSPFTTTTTSTPVFPFSPNPTTSSPFTNTTPSTQPSPFSPNPTTPSTPLFPLPQTPSTPFKTPITPPLQPFQPLQTNTTTPTTNCFNPTQSQQQHQQQQQQQPVVVLVPITNPFGPPRETPQMSYGDVHQYGISSMPVVDRPEPAPVKFSSKLTARHLVRPLSASARKYNAYKNETSNTHPKVPFFQ